MSSLKMKNRKPRTEKVTVPILRDMYNQEERIVCSTAYDATMARMLDQAGIDLILIGDSLGMVIKGEENTLGVEMEDMIYHTQCVAKGVKRAHIMADMPFLSYQSSHEDAVRNAGLLLKAGAQSVKLEGGEEIADLIWYLGQIGIPVMAHIGLKPQMVNTVGGYKVQGKSKVESDMILNDAKIMEEAGAFALLLESVPAEVAQEITESVAIPTIGIGSGVNCNGQILVSYDLLGANPEFSPKFVRRYMDLFGQVTKAVSHYCEDVRGGVFPNEGESFHRTLVEVKPVGKK